MSSPLASKACTDHRRVRPHLGQGTGQIWQRGTIGGENFDV